MLYYTTIYPSTLQLLKNLQKIDNLKKFYLVGGTSLALQIGHRISIDLDLFANDRTKISSIPELIKDIGEIRITNQTDSIINLFVNDIKVDFVNYRYEYLKPPIFADDLILASIEDIAAMKVAAITGRGSRKDFIDLYFILEKFSLPEVFDFYEKKFPDGSKFMAFKSLTYFEDAEIEPMPKMIEKISWSEVKTKIISEVKTHFP